MTIARKGPGSNTRNAGHFANRDSSLSRPGQVGVVDGERTVLKNGDVEWYRQDGSLYKRERRGGVENGGREEWYEPGRGRHRLDGPAVQDDGGIENGGKELWFKDNSLHRLGGPAVRIGGGVSRGGYEEWYENGVRHRTDGPAVKGVHRGEIYEVYYLEDKGYSSKKDWLKAKKKKGYV